MPLDEAIARMAIRIILPASALEKMGFRQIDAQQWRCNGETFEYTAKYHNINKINVPALFVRNIKTRELSMVVLLNTGYSLKQLPYAGVNRKLTQRELMALPDFIE